MEENSRRRQIKVTGWTQLLDHAGAPVENYRSVVAFLDEKEHKIEETRYNNASVITSRKQFGASGEIIEEVCFDDNGQFEHKETYTYGEDGGEIEKTMYLSEECVHNK